MYHKVGVCNHKQVGLGLVGGRHGFGRRHEEGGMVHRVFNDACWVIHLGFFCGKQKQPSTLVVIDKVT